MAGHKAVKTLRAIIESEGVEVLAVNSAGHVKFEVSYKGREFTLVTGNNNFASDRRKSMAFRGDVRRAKKAIDDNDETLKRKYFGAHE